MVVKQDTKELISINNGLPFVEKPIPTPEQRNGHTIIQMHISQQPMALEMWYVSHYAQPSYSTDWFWVIPDKIQEGRKTVVCLCVY